MCGGNIAIEEGGRVRAVYKLLRNIRNIKNIINKTVTYKHPKRYFLRNIRNIKKEHYKNKGFNPLRTPRGAMLLWDAVSTW